MTQQTVTISHSSYGLWNLPDGWEWVRLGQAFNIRSGTLNPSRSPDELFSLYSMPAYDAGGIPEVCYGRDIGSSKVVVQTGDILLSKLNPRIPRVWYVSQDDNRTKLASTDFLSLVCQNDPNGKSYFHPDFIKFLLLSKTFRNQISRDVQGATGSRQRLNRETILSTPLPRPQSLDIQRRIVAQIEALLAEVRASRKLLDEMRRDCDRLLAVSLTDVFNKLEPVIDIVPLEEVATAFNGRASGSGISSVRVFKTRHVYPHTLRLNDPSYAKPEQAPSLPAERFLKPGDVLMANIAEGTLGRVSYVEEAEESWTVDAQIMILRSKDENELIGKWLYYYLWSERGQQEILARRTGIAFADKRGQTHIYPKNVVEIPVPKPSINAQRQAVAYLDTILYETEKMAELIEQDAKTLDLLEQSILERAFRGEL